MPLQSLASAGSRGGMPPHAPASRGVAALGGKVVSVDKDWVKVEFFDVTGPYRPGWVNLNQVGAIKSLSKAETEAVKGHEAEERAP